MAGQRQRLQEEVRLAAADSDAATLGALIDEVLDIPLPMIAQDVTANREASRRALDEVTARCGV